MKCNMKKNGVTDMLKIHASKLMPFSNLKI